MVVGVAAMQATVAAVAVARAAAHPVTQKPVKVAASRAHTASARHKAPVVVAMARTDHTRASAVRRARVAVAAVAVAVVDMAATAVETVAKIAVVAKVLPSSAAPTTP